MKNIGILTFHNAHNYGAVLQALALQKTLEYHNFNSQIINYKNDAICNQYIIFKPLSSNIFNNIKKIGSGIIFYTRKKPRFNNFTNFISKYLATTYPVKCASDIQNINFDAIITGSDQVWNYKLTGGSDDLYMLNFPTNAKKISYAASVGDTRLITASPQTFLPLQKIANISVREYATKNHLEKILQKNITVTLDPTLLLNKESWTKILNLKTSTKERYIFAYTPVEGDKSFYRNVNELASITKLKIIFFEKNIFTHYIHGEKKNKYYAGPKEFLELLINSEYVITSSFHGLAFSIIFNKPFFIIANDKPERLLTIIEKAKLPNRIITKTNTVDQVLSQKINWEKSNAALELERQKSLDWLIESLRGDK